MTERENEVDVMSRQTKLDIEIEDLNGCFLNGSEAPTEREAVGASVRPEAVSVPTQRPSEQLQAMPRLSASQGIVPSAKGQALQDGNRPRRQSSRPASRKARHVNDLEECEDDCQALPGEPVEAWR